MWLMCPWTSSDGHHVVPYVAWVPPLFVPMENKALQAEMQWAPPRV